MEKEIRDYTVIKERKIGDEWFWEIPAMTIGDKQFTEYMHSEARKKYITFIAFQKFKSVNRAIKRGHVSPVGMIYPKRPFNNRKVTLGRKVNEDKKSIYARIKNYQKYPEG
jgi:hypothetical protein